MLTVDRDLWQEITDAVLSFVRQEVVPLERDNADVLENQRAMYTPAGKYSDRVLELRREVRRRSHAAGFYTMFGDPALGGAGGGIEQLALTFEQLFRETGPGRLLIEDVIFPSVLTNGLTPVLSYMTEDVRAQYIERISTGEVTLALALTESEAGSDIWQMKTTARRDGSDWVLSGSKQWITNAPYADYLMVFAITDRELMKQRKGGISCFWVDANLPGVSRDEVLPILGRLGSDLGSIYLDEVRIPADHIVGEINEGFKPAFSAINKGRISMAAKCLGHSEWALDVATEAANGRRVFGSVVAHQGQVEAMLANCAIDIYALKSMLLRVAVRLDAEGVLTGGLKETSIVKVFGTESANRVFDLAMQICGANGLSNEMRLEEGYRWARSMRIPDGTSEIQRRTIARQLIRGDRVF
jgi:acyl-CoA dehydrogenase